MFDFLKKTPKMATHAKIEFVRSGKILNWSISDGTLLQFAEKNNIATNKSCCKGHCGVCEVSLIAGEIFYAVDISFKPNVNKILLCSAYPAVKRKSETPHIRIDL